MKTVKEIITEYVKIAGGDGLYNPDVGCGCDIDDFCPCGEWFGDCVPAKKIPCSECMDIRPCVIQEDWGNDECYKIVEDKI